ncbi:MAG: VOC family protein, partial [Thiomonas sp.]
AGWGTYLDDGRQELALWLCQPFNGQPASAGNGTMVALAARTRAQVDAFHAAALAQGGTNEGAPGLRPHYGPDFYAAYVRDPDGNKLAAVCRAAPSASGLGA